MVMICAVLSVERVDHEVAAFGFPFPYLSGSLTYVRRHESIK